MNDTFKEKVLSKLSIVKILPGTFDLTGCETISIMYQLHPGDIILKGYKRYLDSFFRPQYPHGGIYFGKDQVAVTTSWGIELEDIVTFCRCDRLIILRVTDIPERNEIIERAFRRTGEFIEITNQYVCTFNNIENRLYSLDLIDMCYRELNFSRTNKKLTDDSFLKNKHLEIMYGNRIQPI